MIQDWTQGGEAVVYQACGACGAVWYFRRAFCPRCGRDEPEERAAGGGGTVHAVTLVARAPTEALRAHAPYAIVLVDTDEGFRMMAHGDAALRIGDRVRCRFISLAGQLLPFYTSPHSPITSQNS
jgi:uncharacterized OB-fold protein